MCVRGRRGGGMCEGGRREVCVRGRRGEEVCVRGEGGRWLCVCEGKERRWCV